MIRRVALDVTADQTLNYWGKSVHNKRIANQSSHSLKIEDVLATLLIVVSLWVLAIVVLV